MPKVDFPSLGSEGFGEVDVQILAEYRLSAVTKNYPFTVIYWASKILHPVKDPYFWDMKLKKFPKIYVKCNYAFIGFRFQARQQETKQSVKRDEKRGKMELKPKAQIALSRKNL